MGIHGNWWDFFPWNLKKLSERAAKITACITSKVWKLEEQAFYFMFLSIKGPRKRECILN